MEAVLNPKLLDVVELEESVQGIPAKRQGTIVGFKQKAGVPSFLIELADSEGVPVEITARAANEIKTVWSAPDTAAYRSEVPEAEELFENGLLFLQNGSVRSAKEFFARAFELEPKFAGTLSNLANAIPDTKSDTAAFVYQLIIELRPEYMIARDNLAATFVNRGLEFARRELIERAIEDFNAALLVKPSQNVRQIIQTNLAAAYTRLGLIHSNLKQYQEAVQFFVRAFEILPSEATGRNVGLAFISHFTAVTAGRTDAPREQLEELFRRVMQIGLSRSECLNAYGATLALLGWMSEAVSVLESAVKSDPQNKIARENLNLLLKRDQAPAPLLPGFIPLEPQSMEHSRA